MGNPPILASRDVAARPLETPELQWSVYLLRKDGQKLDREQILGTHQLGHLTIVPRDVPCAYLEDRHGNQLAALREVRVRRLTKQGGLLLTGLEQKQSARELREARQGWWCVLRSTNC